MFSAYPIQRFRSSLASGRRALFFNHMRAGLWKIKTTRTASVTGLSYFAFSFSPRKKHNHPKLQVRNQISGKSELSFYSEMLWIVENIPEWVVIRVQIESFAEGVDFGDKNRTENFVPEGVQVIREKSAMISFLRRRRNNIARRIMDRYQLVPVLIVASLLILVGSATSSLPHDSPTAAAGLTASSSSGEHSSMASGGSRRRQDHDQQQQQQQQQQSIDAQSQETKLCPLMMRHVFDGYAPIGKCALLWEVCSMQWWKWEISVISLSCCLLAVGNLSYDHVPMERLVLLARWEACCYTLSILCRIMPKTIRFEALV